MKIGDGWYWIKGAFYGQQVVRIDQGIARFIDGSRKSVNLILEASQYEVIFKEISHESDL